MCAGKGTRDHPMYKWSVEETRRGAGLEAMALVYVKASAELGTVAVAQKGPMGEVERGIGCEHPKSR